MRSTLAITISIFLILSCNSKIKNADSEVEIEEGTQVAVQEIVTVPPATIPIDEQNLLGFWVGYFREDTEGYSKKTIYADEGFSWTRENKINISIDKISDGVVVGHSVVAGNNRPFIGTVRNGQFVVKEPGSDKYDGEFKFYISADTLIGKWSAFNNIEIKNRKYSLIKTGFSYNPDIMLEKNKTYIDWNTFVEKKQIEEVETNEVEEWVTTEFASATSSIYAINASNTLLKTEEVENLKKGDLTIIRNTIYARHGYSFKNRPLRVFFDAQAWYIPVHADIKSDFTDIEKANIKLLLRYEKNALEYYDYFGRG